MHQRLAFLQLGVQHHRAADVTHRPIRRTLEHLHHAAEMQQRPGDQACRHNRHTWPFVGGISHGKRRSDEDEGDDF